MHFLPIKPLSYDTGGDSCGHGRECDLLQGKIHCSEWEKHLLNTVNIFTLTHSLSFVCPVDHMA
jgi:hypothetical protein